MSKAEQLIKKYSLQPHPEGGWYKQTYKSKEFIPSTALPERFDGERVFSTAIYFLLERGNFSAFHRIKSDECWHFYAGDALNIYIIDITGELKVVTLGKDDEQHFQYVVPANSWFASQPVAGSEFSFVGCTVAPGFEFDDFELADAKSLSLLYPQHASIIKELCR